ncbi:MAG: hypothetical protein H0T41_00315 [Rhodobacteraceae bacterium]|nr:hypothetical protein [Paracoccaceae bacterium]
MSVRAKLLNGAFVLMAGGLSACQGGVNPFASRAASDAFAAITTEEAFRAEVVGREVVYANGAVGSYGEDGTWSVRDGDAVIGSGTWEWTGDRWCREGATVEGPVEAACDAVAVSDGGVRFTGEDGVQGTLPFRV